MSRPRKKQRPRRKTPASPPPTPPVRAPEPAWAVQRWGLVRLMVIALAAATALGIGTLDAAVFLAEQSTFWLIVGLGVGSAGLVSALRATAVPAVAILLREKGSHGRAVEIVGVRTLGDAGAAVLVIVVGVVLRTAVIAAGSGWAAEIIQSLLLAPVAVFIVFTSLLIVGWLLVLAVGGFVHLARRRRTGQRVPASAWWTVAVVAALALAVPATFAVGLSDTTSVPVEGSAAIGAFFFGDVVLAHPWQYIALWIARLGAYGAGVSLIGLVISRWSERRRA